MIFQVSRAKRLVIRIATLTRANVTRRAEFAFVEDRVSDALTAADQIAGPGGTPMTVGQRIADMLARHGPGSPSARAHIYRGPYLYAAAGRVVDRLEAVGEDTTGIF